MVRLIVRIRIEASPDYGQTAGGGITAKPCKGRVAYVLRREVEGRL